LTISLGFTSARFVEVGEAVGVKLTPLESRAEQKTSAGTAAQVTLTDDGTRNPERAKEGLASAGLSAFTDAVYGQ